MASKYQIYYTPTFRKQFNKIPKSIKLKAYKKESLFRNDPFTKSLKTHKLKGNFKNYWSFSIDYSYRIVFRFISSSKILFVDVGKHDVYK